MTGVEEALSLQGAPLHSRLSDVAASGDLRALAFARKAIGEPPARIVRAWSISGATFQRRGGKYEYADIVIQSGHQETRVLEC